MAMTMMNDLTHEQAQSLLDHAPQAMLLLDSGGTIRGYNRAFTAVTGVAETDIADTGLIQPLLGTSTVVNWIMPGGDERWLAIEVAELADLPDIQARFYTDVTEKLRLRHERDALQQQLDDQVLYDARISSLLSRRGILISLAPLVARSRRYNNPPSIITLSISTQQEEHDAALNDITALLRDQTRWADLVGLNDSDAFILVLQETTLDAALQLVEKLAAHIERMNAADATRLVARYGITECQTHDDADSLLERAEQALAEAARGETGRTVAM